LNVLARGYSLTHGPAGYGFYGLPLPWGVTPEIDYFLRANLHGGEDVDLDRQLGDLERLLDLVRAVNDESTDAEIR
jgi:hypothetical protein